MLRNEQTRSDEEVLETSIGTTGSKKNKKRRNVYEMYEPSSPDKFSELLTAPVYNKIQITHLKRQKVPEPTVSDNII